MTTLSTSIFPSVSFDLSYANYLTYLQFTDKHTCETESLSTLLPTWLGKRNKLATLDVGAGNGRLAQTIYDLYGKSSEQFTMMLLEPALAASEKLEARFAHDERISIVSQSLQDFTANGQEGRYDLVLASHVCYYFEDRIALFKSLCRLVAPGGVLCCIAGSISLVEHPIYQELLPQILADSSIERSFGLDGYGSCAEELQLISFCNDHLLSSISVPASMSFSSEQILQAAQALGSLATTMDNDLCKCLGFLWRIPIEAVYRKRQLILDFFERHGAFIEDIHIPCQDKFLLLRMPNLGNA